MMTEEEAKKKICKRFPVCTSIDTNCEGSQQRFYEEFTLHCIASACMMWRWEKYLSATQFEADGNTPIMKQTNCGFCGLGGKP